MASISRFGRAISSGKVESDSSLPNSASVSSAVRSSRFAKSDSAVAVVIKKSSRSVWPGQSVMAQASSIAAGLAGHALKRLGNYHGLILSTPVVRWPYENTVWLLSTRIPSANRVSPQRKYDFKQKPNLRLARNLLLIFLAVLLLPYLLAPLYRAGHPVSTLMAWRWLTGAPVNRHWVDFNAISPFVTRSVVAAEDAKFCNHHGIDWGALREAMDDAEDGEATRGGSTITQQVAKNLFLWPGRSVVRKALEFPLALWIDLVLPKQRILEIYLNIAE